MERLDPLLFGRNIRDARIRKGYSQKQLGHLIHSSTSHISHLENGTNQASLDTVLRISNVLGTSVDALLLDQYAHPETAAELQVLRLYRRLDRKRRHLAVKILKEIAKDPS